MAAATFQWPKILVLALRGIGVASARGLTPGEIHKVVDRFVGSEGASGLSGFSHEELAKFLSVNAEVEPEILAKMDGMDKRSKLKYALEKSTPEGQARILEALLECYHRNLFRWRFPPYEQERDRPRLAPQLERMVSGLRGSATLVEKPQESQSVAVHTAIQEAQTLLRNHGASAALDRVHTALMAYMQEALAGAGVPFNERASATDLFALLRERHPAFALPAEVHGVGGKLYRSIGAGLESFNAMRNEWSRAHPGGEMPPELASLGLDFAMAVVRDLDRRLGAIARLAPS